MTPREVTEAIERQILSPRAQLSAETRGRQKPEPPCPIRTEFQRDRDRIIHSKAFRRLSHKTQVFIAPEGDHYRTRLTHTLEVAQIARTIARALRLNEDLTEAIALGHDLGHTPFGHQGEEALDEAYRRYDPNAGFRHYEHSLRIVNCLEKNGRGLNLTYEVLDGIGHHSKGQSDLRISRTVQRLMGTSLPATLEGQIMRVADRVAYVNHDVDDALRSGILTEKDLPQDILRVLGKGHGERITNMVTDIIQHSIDSDYISMSDEILEATDALKDFLFERVYADRSIAKTEIEKVRVVIHGLFDFYMQHPEQMPSYNPATAVDTKALARQVCDYIAGMTDRYATHKYEQHFVPKGWRGV
ncbi:MAG: deoxyguanosinetriphosphate triphosphohydrolase [Abditibacteriales bacterium]|nr:deoxyguanosinetriphosphate triphosphohydrolase [Abditibacteriales bacterium]MDW8367343.1 deoxyguanosinetriphosphate triphosphohydrolase [Abditibacteriales bacterium]